MSEAVDRLRALLRSLQSVSIAVSGGVDSLTLASVAHDVLGGAARLHHATSPAVPPQATRRTREVAGARGWSLDVFDAGEFADPRYRSNPSNRCYFCKINLYGAIASRTDCVILSGTNLDDLGEYRPGLDAAREHDVRHPFVEAGIDKAMVRRIATEMDLGDVAELPASPCLSSRVETGIAIQAPMLAMIDRIEQLVSGRVSPRTIRCRVRAAGIVIELDPQTLTSLGEPDQRSLCGAVLALAADSGVTLPVSLAGYRNGSAFLRGRE